ERAAFWSVLADDQDRGMTVQVPDEPVPVGLAAADLAASLDVLLGNVFAHTPEGAGFTVRLTARPEGGGELSVLDTGPGFDTAGAPVQPGATRGGASTRPGIRPGGGPGGAGPPGSAWTSPGMPPRPRAGR